MERRLHTIVVIAGAAAGAVMMTGLVAQAYDTTWVAAGSPVSASSLKSNLDEIQSRLASAEAALAAVPKTPPGTIVAFGGSTPPSGWVLCDGMQYNGLDAQYAALYAAIGTAYGGNVGSKAFNVPDLRGRFLRGTDMAQGRDPNAGTRTASSVGGATGDAVGSLQSDSFRSHNHGGGNHNHNTGTIDISGGAFNSNGSYLGRASTSPNLAGTVNNSGTIISTEGGSETRPVNVNVNYLIKL